MVVTKNINPEIFTVDTIADASKKEKNGGIVAITATQADDESILLFAAVKNAQKNNFGAQNSGIALARFSQQSIDQDVSEQEIKKIQEGLKGASEQDVQRAMRQFTISDGKYFKKVVTKKCEHKDTAELSHQTPAAKIGNNLNEIGSIVDMHWSHSLQRLYIAIQATAGSDCNDGAYGIVVGQVKNDCLELYPIVLPDIVTHDALVAVRGAHASISMHKVRALQTTTGGLDYLIVVGGSGLPNQTQSHVYALPLN